MDKIGILLIASIFLPVQSIQEANRLVDFKLLEISDTNGTLRFSLENSRRSFVIVGTYVEGIVDKSAKHTASLSERHIEYALPSKHRWLTGFIEGEKNSHVALSWTGQNAETPYGIISSPVDGNWILEHEDGSVRLLAENEIEAHGGCGSNANNAEKISIRHRRVSSQTSAAHTECDVFLDADTRFFAHWKGECPEGENSCLQLQLQRVAVKMIDALHLTDNMYTTNGIKLRLAVAGTHILVSQSPIPENIPMQKVLDAYGMWLATGVDSLSSVAQEVRGSGTKTSTDVCLNHMFTHYDNTDSTQGYGNQDVVCDTEWQHVTFQGVTRWAARNAAFVTTISNGKTSSHLATARIVAHEIGHNLGALHDCCQTWDACTADNGSGLLSGKLNPCPTFGADNGFWPVVNGKTYEYDSTLNSCVPSDYETEGGYIMYPTSLDDSNRKNFKIFSECSKDAIHAMLSQQGSCLRVPSPCRNGGECCSGSSLKTKGTQCRPKDESSTCRGNAVCDGVHAECPLAQPKEDGSICDGRPSDSFSKGECFRGDCVPVNTKICDKFLSKPCPISKVPPGGECIQACDDPNNDVCVPVGSGCPFNLFQGRVFSDPPPLSQCPENNAGTPCTKQGSPGTCDVSGICQLNNPCAFGGTCCQDSGQLRAAGEACDQECETNKDLVCDGTTATCPGLQVEGGLVCINDDGEGRCGPISGKCDNCFDSSGSLSSLQLNNQALTCSQLGGIAESQVQSLCSQYKEVSDFCPRTCGVCTPIAEDLGLENIVSQPPSEKTTATTGSDNSAAASYSSFMLLFCVCIIPLITTV